jgi:hypothetical protein
VGTSSTTTKFRTTRRAKFRPKGSFKSNEKYFDADILKPLEQCLPKACEKVWIVGNHDRWETDMDDENPELEGCFDRVVNLKLEDRGWKVVRDGLAYKLGKLTVIHGDQLATGFGLGLYPTRRALDIYMKSVLFGHVHYAQSNSKVSPVEHTQKYMAWSSPCLCNINPEYMKNKPSAWLNGFTIVEVLPNGDFNVYPIVVVGGRFSYGGKVYGK